MLNKTFYKFLFGFLAIIVIVLAVSYVVGVHA